MEYVNKDKNIVNPKVRKVSNKKKAPERNIYVKPYEINCNKSFTEEIPEELRYKKTFDKTNVLE